MLGEIRSATMVAERQSCERRVDDVVLHPEYLSSSFAISLCESRFLNAHLPESYIFLAQIPQYSQLIPIYRHEILTPFHIDETELAIRSYNVQLSCFLLTLFSDIIYHLCLRQLDDDVVTVCKGE